jgi:hypothetical protein
MAEVVNSLFGITPESLQADRDAALQAQALQYAKLDPFQRATAAIYSGANRLGGAVGGMLGAQDPEMMRIRQRQQLLEGADISDPKVLRERATLAMQQNDYPAAQQLASRAMDIEAKQASIAKDVAAANKETKLSVPARVLQSQAVAELKDAVRVLKAQPETPEIKAAIQRYEDQLQDLEPAEKTVNFGAETERISKAKYNKPYSQLTQAQAAEVDKEMEKRDLASKKAGAGKPVDVASIIKEIGTKEDIKGKSDAWKAAGDAYKLQVPMIEKLKEVKDALPKSFTGSFADITLQFGKGLSALGVPVDRAKLSNTEYMNSVSAQVLQTIARNFPGSLAVKEMDQLVKSKFSSQQQIETITRVLNDLQTEIEAGTKSYEQLAKLPETERYTKDLNLLTGQNFSKLKRYRALEQKANSLGAGQKMTAKEVEEAKKLQAELGV